MSAQPGLTAPARHAEPRAGLATVVVIGALLAFSVMVYRQFGPHMIEDQDFLALWSYGVAAAGHPTADIYDPVRLHELQVGLGMDAARQNPFPYLPNFLLVARALAVMPIEAAFAVWTALGLAAFAWASSSSSFRLASVVGAILSPAVSICVVFGKSGLLCGALMLGGLRLMKRRPLLAGVLLGLLTLKPQFGLLIPVALVSAGAWRCVAAAFAAAAGLALASTAFGLSAWGEWLSALPGYEAWFGRWGASVNVIPTVTAFLLHLGTPPSVADAGQAASAILMAAIVWRLFRADPGPRALAAFPAATLLATPHALIYDMPMLAGGAILCLASSRPSVSGAACCILALAAPALMVSSPAPWPVAAPLVACCLVWTLARRMSGPAPEPARRPVASIGLVPAPQA